MQKMYSKSTGSTYLVGIHSDIPKDAKPLSDERYDEVFSVDRKGRLVGHDKDGMPILVDPEPPTDEQLEQCERIWRDGEIYRLQWLRDRHRDQLDLSLATTLTAVQFTELLEFLQLLRDWPQTGKFPDPKYRPTAPEWIVDQDK